MKQHFTDIETYLNHYIPGVGNVRAVVTLHDNLIITIGDWQPFTPTALRVEAPLGIKQKRRRRGKRRGRRWALIVVGGKLIEALPLKQ